MTPGKVHLDITILGLTREAGSLGIIYDFIRSSSTTQFYKCLRIFVRTLILARMFVLRQLSHAMSEEIAPRVEIIVKNIYKSYDETSVVATYVLIIISQKVPNKKH